MICNDTRVTKLIYGIITINVESRFLNWNFVDVIYVKTVNSKCIVAADKKCIGEEDQVTRLVFLPGLSEQFTLVQ